MPHEGVVSPYTTNMIDITPVWRDCTPARLSPGVSVLTSNNGGWTITLSTISLAETIVGYVTTAGLGPNLRGPCSA